MNAEARERNAFVFVVCGSREHLDTLHYSLRAIKRFSRSRIVVVTDSARNELPVHWHDIVDVATPRQMDHHQASIYLKTRLHRILPPGPSYCYLDTDIVALGPQVDEIFQHKSGPITFAPDHCRLKEFSPSALYCGCQETHEADLTEMWEMLAVRFNVKRAQPAPPTVEPKKPVSRIRRALAFLPFRRNAQAAKPEETKPAPTAEQIERYARWVWDQEKDLWISPDGHEIRTVACNHLVEQIGQTFGIQVQDPNWQHWNGGVFLFDEESHEFLDAWHDKTMAIFTNPAWRTRDQGTLIATAWEFGLQDAQVLSRNFNFIVDYFQETRNGISADRAQITNNGFASMTAPSLIHIYHHFGDQSWDIWNWVEEQIEGNGGTFEGSPSSTVVQSGAKVVLGSDAS